MKIVPAGVPARAPHCHHPSRGNGLAHPRATTMLAASPTPNGQRPSPERRVTRRRVTPSEQDSGTSARRTKSNFSLVVKVVMVLAAVLVQAAVTHAQTIGLSTDIGAVGAAGSSTFNASTGTYLVNGAGVGLGDGSDAFHFDYASVCGDGQMVVRLSGADATSQAALVVRGSLEANAASAAVSVSNGAAQFVRRLAAGNNPVLGAPNSVSLPCWLKLERSGTTISAFVSADGQAWTSLGSDTVDLGSSIFYAGLAVSNGLADGTSTSAASFDNEQASFLPADGLLLWLKPDAGVTPDASGNVAVWADQSAQGNDAFAPAGNRPQWLANALNGQPVLRFDGGTSYLQLPAGFSDFTQGITALVVAKPTTAAYYARFFDLGNGAGQQNIVLARFGTSDSLEFYSQNSPVDLYAGTLGLNQYQLVECEQNPATQLGSLYRNGVALLTGGAGPIVNITRTSNFIGRDNWSYLPLYQGDIAEVLIFNRALTDNERQVWEAYLNAKYNYDPVPTVPTQLVATPLSASQAALNWVDTFGNISGYRVEEQNADGTWSVVATLPGSTTNYTVTGLTAGTAYQFRVIASNGTGDSVAAAVSLNIPATVAALPASDLRLWLRADSGTIADANGLLSQWVDDSGHGFSATQSSGSQPTVVAGALNGLPVVHFDGSSSFLNLPTRSLSGLTGAEVFIVLRASDPLVNVQRGFWRFTDTSDAVYPWSDGNIYESFGSSGQYGFGPGSTPLDQFNLYNVSAEGTGAWAARMNGQVLHSTTKNTVNFAAGAYTLGRDHDGRLFAGDIAEVMIFDHALDSNKRHAVEQYLASKYALVPPPATPSGLVGRSLSPTQISLSWQYPQKGGATQFAVERTVGGINDFQTIAVVNNATSFIDSTAAAGTAYNYQVAAIDLAGNTSAASDPTQVSTPAAGTAFPTTGLRVWLAADAGTTNGALGSWLDQSGNGNDAVPASVGNEPTVVANALNGRPVVHFDGSSSYLNLPTSALSALAGAEVFIVVRATDPVAGVQRGLWRFTDSNDAVFPWSDGNIYETFGTNSQYGFSPGSAPLDQFNLYNVSASANGTWTAQLNGRVFSSTQSNTVNFAAGAYTLGRDHDGRLFAGDIAEIMIFDHALDPGERHAVEQYLAGKYALASAPATPSSLTAHALSPTQINLTWQYPQGSSASQFAVQRAAAGSNAFQTIAVVDNATSFIDNSAVAGTAYTYQIVATDLAGDVSPASSATTASTPTSGSMMPTSGLCLWLEADAGTIGSGSLGSWVDQSGNGNNAQQSSNGNQPQVVAGVLNGQPVVRFDASKGQYLNLPNLLSGATAAEMVIVLKSAASPGASNGVSTFGVLPNEDLYTYANGNMYSGFGTTSQYCLGVPPTSLGQFNIYHLSSQAGLWQSWMNGALFFQSNTNTVAFTSSPLLGLDREGYYFTGDIAEVLVYNRALSESERQGIEGYLNAKYEVVAPPTAPASLSAAAITSTQSNLLWTASATANGYSVERKDAAAPDSAYTEVASVPGGAVQAYVDGSLTPGASYTYRLRAYNLGGYSDYSGASSLSLPAAGTNVLPVDDLLLWLKPDAGVTLDANGSVSAWTDASGHANDAFAPTGSRPQWVGAALNGLPVLRFNGGSSYLRLPTGFSDFTQGITALVVAKPVANTSYARFFDIGNGAGQQNILFARLSTSNGLEFYSQNSPFELDTPSGLSLNQYQLVEAVLDPTAQQASAYQNGVTLGSVAAGPIVNTVRTSNFIGRSNYGDPLYQGDIAEVLIFNKSLSPTERQAWELYLNAKYNYDPVPTPPTQVSAAVLSATQVAIGWVDSFVNIANYRVEQQNADGTLSVIAILPAGTTNYVASGLTPGASYTFRVTASNRTGDSSSISTALVSTPASGGGFPAASLRLWLRADSGTIADASGLLSQWVDDSGNGFSATQSSGSQPTVVANALNGLPVVHFDGSSSYLNLPTTLANGLTGGEVFVVLRGTDPLPNARHGLWRFSDGSIAEYPWSDGDIYETFGTNSQYGFTPGATPLDQFNLYNVSAAATGAWTARLNGQMLYSTQNNTVSFTPWSFTLGRDRDGRLFAGDVAEVMIFDHALTDAERQAVQAYTASKYGLAATPPAPILNAFALSPGRVGLDWMCPPGNAATRFRVEREIAGSNDYQVIATVSDAASFIDATVAGGTAYSYRVTALNFIGGASTYSNEAQALAPATGTDMPVTGLRLWLKAGAGTPGPLSRWVDQSGNGNDAVPTSATGSPRVVYDTFAANWARPAVQFDGTDSLQLPDNLLSGVTAAEVFIVLRAADPLSGSATRGLWNLSGGSGYGSGAFYPDYSGNLYETFGTNTRYGPMASLAPLDQFNLYDVAAAANVWTASLNGQVLSSTQTNTLTFSPGNILLGRSTEGVPFMGDIAEVLVFDHTLTDAERQAVQRYCTWQYALGSLLAGPPDADADGDGISNYQEFLNGTDPLDYYNGATPLIAMLGGNEQPGSAGAFVAQPLGVKVTSAAGVPLVNAPVVFAVTRNSGLVADPAAPSNLASTVTVRTGADGTASVLFQVPTGPPTLTSLVTATAGTATRINHVTFAEAIVATDDSSGDGLPDGWKLQYGLDLTTNDAAGDPDGDGLTNLQEYYLGTNPNVPDVTADGVPFGWLVARGLNPLFDPDTALDPNGAGLTYLQEYQLAQSTIDLWPFDEGGQSTTTTSSSGYKDTGVLVNNPAWTTDPDGGGALLFGQTGAQVDFALAPDGHLDFAAQQSFSITARFQTTATGVARLAGKGTEADSAAAGYFLGLENGQLTAGIGSGDPSDPSLRLLTQAAYNDGQWHHVAAVFDRSAGQARLYVDGVLQAVTLDAGSAGVSQGTSVDFSAATGLSAARPDTAFLIGALDLDGDESFAGSLDNVGLFSKALTEAEIKALAGHQNNAPPVVAIDSPLAGAEFPEQGSISIDAQASSSTGAISKVEFFDGPTKLGEADAFPYNLTWAQVPVGTYAITAKATDTRGASATSATVTITVSTDSNHNGIPDDWEIKFFGNLDQSANGSYLNDGISNLTKYLLGLDPTKPVSTDSTASAAVGLQVYTPLQ